MTGRGDNISDPSDSVQIWIYSYSDNTDIIIDSVYLRIFDLVKMLMNSNRDNLDITIDSIYRRNFKMFEIYILI